MFSIDLCIHNTGDVSFIGLFGAGTQPRWHTMGGTGCTHPSSCPSWSPPPPVPGDLSWWVALTRTPCTIRPLVSRWPRPVPEGHGDSVGALHITPAARGGARGWAALCFGSACGPGAGLPGRGCSRMAAPAAPSHQGWSSLLSCSCAPGVCWHLWAQGSLLSRPFPVSAHASWLRMPCSARCQQEDAAQGCGSFSAVPLLFLSLQP